VVGVELRFRLEDTVESPLSVRIFQGLCRPDRLEWVIQKGTELGVAAIYPLECERGERPPQGPPRADRWRRIALEACKQSGRRVLPDVSPAETLPAAEDRCALLLDPGPDAVPLRTALPAGSPAGVDLAVGPEGGFTDAERDLACGNGWIPVSLGPRVLRTETAGLVAAAIVLHCLGDLGAV
jgi:16S rRNA (uracil1498-N3)-methyltransferase